MESWDYAEEVRKKQQEFISSEQFKNRGTVSILFNKGRYFEFQSSLPQKEYISLARAIKQKQEKISFKNNTFIGCFCGPKRKLEAVVTALNKRGYYAKITIDWV